VDKKQASDLVNQTRSILPDARIMMCLPGNKIRTANLSEPIRLTKGESFILHDYEINYPFVTRFLKKGDIVLANDSIFSFEVVEAIDNSIKLLSHSDGLLFSNKGLNLKGIYKDLPFLFDKDRRLIEMATELKIDYLALSFVRNAEDVKEVRNILRNSNMHLIAKIETLSAVQNLDSIINEADSILVDRGDLSTEIGILKLATTQDRIIDAAFSAKKDVYLATHFLKNMETKPIPLIPEIIDLCKTIKSGIAGIQLSEETAIGKYPLECVKLVFEAFNSATMPEAGKIVTKKM